MKRISPEKQRQINNAFVSMKIKGVKVEYAAYCVARDYLISQSTVFRIYKLSKYIK